MDCKAARDCLVPYVLDALDDASLRSLESHLETCARCALLIGGDGESIAELARAVPQRVPPESVERALFSRIDSPGRLKRALLRARARLRAGAVESRRRLSPRTGALVAGCLVLLVVAAGVWFNERLDRITEDTELLAGQLALARERESEVLHTVSAQRRQTYEALEMSAAPGAAVNTLMGTGPWSTARGLIMVSGSSNMAILVVVDLPPLPSDRVYQVWLSKDHRKYGFGWFTVDSTGYGQTVIIPVAPFWEFDAAGVTIEPHGGSADPTGVSVLKGDL